MATSSEPLVSAIVICYNQARFVVEALDSLQAQTYSRIEPVIIDDCSTDDSVATIERWLERTGMNCTFIRHEQNRGICRTLNDALCHTTGKYVSILAADDVWLPEKTAGQVRQMEGEAEDAGVLYSDAIRIDEAGQVLPTMFIATYRQFQRMPEGNILETLLESNFIPAVTTLIRRSCFDAVGDYDETLVYEDWDMWLRIAQKYRFIYSPIVSANYRLVKTSLSRSRPGAMNESSQRIIRKHLNVMPRSARRIENAARLLTALGRQSYAARMQGSYSLLRQAFMLRPSIRRFVILLFNAMGLPYSCVTRCKAAWRFRAHFSHGSQSSNS